MGTQGGGFNFPGFVLLFVGFLLSGPALSGGNANIDIFESYVNSNNQLCLAGRVHTALKNSSFTLWDNVKKFFSQEHENQWVKVQFQDRVFSIKTDNHGQFRLVVPGVDRALSEAELAIEPTNPPAGEKGARVKKAWLFKEKILQSFAKKPVFGTINDFDDTNIISEVTSKGKMLKNTFLKKMEDRQVIEGAPELMQGYRGGRTGSEENLTFYVTGSPTDLFSGINGFLAKNGFPPGNVKLRQLGWSSIARKGFMGWVREKIGLGNEKTEDDLFHTTEYKLESIRTILRENPGVIFDLRGDSGEQDPEIYALIAREFPGRIGKIYIRNVGPGKTDSAERIQKLQTDLGTPMQLVNHEFETALDSFRRGRLSRDAAYRVGLKVQAAGQLAPGSSVEKILGFETAPAQAPVAPVSSSSLLPPATRLKLLKEKVEAAQAEYIRALKDSAENEKTAALRRLIRAREEFRVAMENKQ